MDDECEVAVEATQHPPYILTSHIRTIFQTGDEPADSFLRTDIPAFEGISSQAPPAIVRVEDDIHNAVL